MARELLDYSKRILSWHLLDAETPFGELYEY
jgi:hypothetical protein